MQAKSKKRMIVANSLLLAFMIFGSVFAWFASNFKNYVASNDVQVISDGDLLLSVDNTNWSNSISLSTKEWFKRTTFTDITGSGDGTFLRPTLQLNADYASIAKSGTWTTPSATNTSDNNIAGTSNYDYVRFTLYMKSKTPFTVNLGAGSYVKPASTYSELSELLGDSAPNKITLSDTLSFSRDLVAGAVRVSGISSSDDHIFTWIPRPEIDATPNNGAITSVSVTASSTTHTYYSKDAADTFTSKDLAPIKTVTGDIKGGTSGNEQTLLTLSGPDESGDYTGQVDFCIWLEGCDNEARRAFVDGKFKVYLNLVAITG